MKKISETNFKKTLIHLTISGCYLNTAMAQIVADYSAPVSQRPVILKGQHNQPIVNIQTPNHKGVSHNRYSQFDVDNKGVMLNNHRINNPHLAKGSANTILNEVRSHKASQINGKIEVLGQRADVIIANPSGININGASTQNINKMVFTTGYPQFRQNEVGAINVDKGKITVGSQGLNSSSDYTYILSRAVEIQGKIVANKLLVAGGAQSTDYHNNKIYYQNAEAKTKPQIGIDTAALGGMYANHIHLITNEYGVGVRNAGTLNGYGTILLDSSGKIENKGVIQANDKLVLRTKNAGANGDILLQPNSRLAGSADMLLNAGGQIKLERATMTQYKHSIYAQPKLTLVGQSITLNAGKLNTPNDVFMTATSGSLNLNAYSVNGTGRLNSVFNDKQNRLKIVENEINKIRKDPKYNKILKDYDDFLDYLGIWDDYTRIPDNEFEDMLRPYQNKLTQLEKEKQKLNSIISILNRTGDTQTHQFSEITANNIQLNSAGGVAVNGANLRANRNIEINSYGSTNGNTISILGKHQIAESGSGDNYSYVSIYQPSTLTAKQHLTLSALQPTGNNRITIKGSKLTAENGVVNILGYGDVVLDYGKDEYYSYHKQTRKHGKIRRKTTTTIHENQYSYATPTVISAKNGLYISAGNHLNLYASQLAAPRGKLHLTAGQRLSLYAVDEQHKHRSESHTKKRFLGIKTGTTHREREQILNEPMPAKLVAQSAHLKSGWDTLLQGTQFHTLTGAKIEVGVGEKARGDAKILLQGIKSSVQQEESKRRSGIVWQSFQNRGLIEEKLTLPTFTGGQPIFNASGGIIVDIPQGKLRNELIALLKKPEYAYLKNLKLNNQVQWREISLAYQYWNYQQQGLTAAGAAIVALSMAVVTGGIGAGSAIGLNGAYAAMANSAFTTLTTQATTSLVNNRGNLTQTFRELGSKKQVKQLASAVISAGVADKLVNVAGVANPNGYLDTLSKNLIEAGSTATVQAVLNGGKFTKALEDAIFNALIDTAHAELAKNIKGIKNQNDANRWYREAAHKIAHAVAGCGAAAGRGGKCSDGALGAVLGEVIGEWLLNGRDPTFLTPKEKEELTNKSKLIVGSVSAVTGGNVDSAAKSAETAIKNNLLWFPILAVGAGVYTYIIGDNDLGAGLTIIADGNDPISKGISVSTEVAISFAMDKAPEATKAVLQGLNQVGSKIEGFVTYIDTKTGKRVSNYWHSIDEQTRKQIIGTTKIVSVIVPASKVGALNNAAKSVKGVNTTQLSQVVSKLESSNMKQLIAQRQSGMMTKNLVLDINGKKYAPIPELSKGASVYKGVSETQIKQLFKELAGVKDLPKPREIKGKASIDGQQGVIYTLNASDGKNIVLRNFSTSADKTNAKWTIEISRLPNSKVKTIEMKFQ